jgi:hypothetical protein
MSKKNEDTCEDCVFFESDNDDDEFEDIGTTGYCWDITNPRYSSTIVVSIGCCTHLLRKSVVQVPEFSRWIVDRIEEMRELQKFYRRQFL